MRLMRLTAIIFTFFLLTLLLANYKIGSITFAQYVTPTPTPTPGPCTGPDNRANGCSCTTNNQCNSQNCSGGICQPPLPTSTPTPPPAGGARYNISGSVFVDNNKDGRKNGTESNYTAARSTIKIYTGNNPSCSGTPADTINTNNGDYSYRSPRVVSQQYTVCYTTLPAASGYRSTYPTGIPPKYVVTVGNPCRTDSSHGSSCSNGDIINLNFGINNSYPWFQCIGASCRIDDIPAPGGGGVIIKGTTGPPFLNPIPPSSPDLIACAGAAYASLQGPSSTSPGIIYSGSSDPDLGVGQTSVNGWQVGGANPETFTPVNPKVIRTSYGYLRTTMIQSGITPIDLATVCDLANCTLPANLLNGVYQANGDLHLKGYTFPANKHYVFLINGRLYIEGSIHVPTGSTALFSTSGGIFVDKSVGESDPCSSNFTIEGFYSADYNFTVQGDNNCDVGTDKRLNIAGSIVVNAKLQGGKFYLQRDLCSDNYRAPAITFSVRPDFILNAPAFIRHQNYVWQEIAP